MKAEDRKMFVRMAHALKVIEEWMQADLLIHGPGPRDGYKRRHEELGKLRAELHDHMFPPEPDQPSGNVPLDLS